jgi:hypothetical protein
MTTDPRPRRPAPRLALSAREWKLYLAGGLGLAYALSLNAVATQAHADTPPVGPASVSLSGNAAGSANSVAWLDELPVADRPPITLPPGWVLASPGEQVAAASAVAPPRGLPTAPSVSAAPRGPRILTRTS